jgi:hypothetical protein
MPITAADPLAQRGFWQDDEKGSITPALPQARQDAVLPELRFRLANILNVP